MNRGPSPKIFPEKIIYHLHSDAPCAKGNGNISSIFSWLKPIAQKDRMKNGVMRLYVG